MLLRLLGADVGNLCCNEPRVSKWVGKETDPLAVKPVLDGT